VSLYWRFCSDIFFLVKTTRQDFFLLRRTFLVKEEEVIRLLIKEVCSIAVYCQCCGKLHIHDIPYFIGSQKLALRCSCGHEEAILLGMDVQHIGLKIPCVVCNLCHEAVFSLKRLRHLPLEKIYCHKDHFELGYIGQRSKIEEMLEFSRRELDLWQKEVGVPYPIEQQQILLQALNRVHDLAARKSVCCRCGNQEVSVDIKESLIILECDRCGSYHVIEAQTDEDLQKLNRLERIELLEYDQKRKKH
jgi:hypothetical protein